MILKDPTCFSFAFFKVSMAQAFADLVAVKGIKGTKIIRF